VSENESELSIRGVVYSANEYCSFDRDDRGSLCVRQSVGVVNTHVTYVDVTHP